MSGKIPGNNAMGKVRESRIVLQDMKRQRDDEEEERTRHVSPRTQPPNESALAADQDEERSMKDIILKHLKSNDEAVLADALDDLYKMMFEAVEKRQDFFHLGGNLATTWVLNEHASCYNIQYNGIAVLGIASFEVTDQKDAIGQVDGMQAIITAMKRFKDEKNLQLLGLNALNNLSSCHAANAHLLVDELDGVPMILERMKMFAKDYHIVLYSCRLLCGLCQLRSLRKTIFDAKALSSLAAAIDQYFDNEDVVETASQAIYSLIKYSKSLYQVA